MLVYCGLPVIYRVPQTLTDGTVFLEKDKSIAFWYVGLRILLDIIPDAGYLSVGIVEYDLGFHILQNPVLVSIERLYCNNWIEFAVETLKVEYKST